MEVLAERDSRANDGSQVEDGPEDTDENTLLLLRGVRKHQGALRSPKQTRTNALDGTCSQNEGTCLGVDVGGATKWISTGNRTSMWCHVQISGDVQSVTEGSELQSQDGSEIVVDWPVSKISGSVNVNERHRNVPGEEREERETSVMHSVGIGIGLRVDATSSTQSVQGVIQTRPHEAHEAQKDNLGIGVVVPRAPAFMRRRR